MLNQGLIRQRASTGDGGALTVTLRDPPVKTIHKGPSALQASTKYGTRVMGGIDREEPGSLDRRF